MSFKKDDGHQGPLIQWARWARAQGPRAAGPRATNVYFFLPQHYKQTVQIPIVESTLYIVSGSRVPESGSGSLLEVKISNIKVSKTRHEFAPGVCTLASASPLVTYLFFSLNPCSNLLWRIFVFVYIYLRKVAYTDVICEMTDQSDRYAVFLRSGINLRVFFS